MKTIILTTILAAIIIFTSAPSDAFDLDSLSGKLTLQANTINPEEGESFQTNSLLASFTHKDLTFGLDIDQAPNFWRFDPYLKKALNENWAAKVGITTDKADKDYLYGTICYGEGFGKLFVFVDIENNFPISSEAHNKGFTDLFYGITHPVNDDLSIGLQGYYDRWWHSKDEATMLGIKTTYSLTEKTSLGLRVARSWFFAKAGDESKSTNTRFEISTKF